VHAEDRELSPRLLREAQRLGVERLVVSSLWSWRHEPAHEECEQANREVRRLMQEHPGLVLGLAYVNPCDERAPGELERCVREFGFVGLKLWVACRISDERVRPLLQRAQELRVPVLQHAWHKITGNLPHESYPEEVARAAADFPQVQFIMAHIGGDWVRGLRAVRHSPNVAVDTSGNVTSGPPAPKAARGSFGTGSPFTDTTLTVGPFVGSQMSGVAPSINGTTTGSGTTVRLPVFTTRSI